MLLRHALQTLLAIYGVEKINDNLAAIFHDRHRDAMEDGRTVEGLVLDLISEHYDSLNYLLTNRTFFKKNQINANSNQ